MCTSEVEVDIRTFAAEAGTQMPELEAGTSTFGEEVGTHMSEVEVDRRASQVEADRCIPLEVADSRLQAVAV